MNTENVETGRWQRSRWTWNASLSMDASGILLQTQKGCRTSADSGQEYLTTRKEYTDPGKIRQDERRSGKKGEWAGLHLHMGGWGTWSRGQFPLSGKLCGTLEKHLGLLECRKCTHTRVVFSHKKRKYCYLWELGQTWGNFAQWNKTETDTLWTLKTNITQ